MDNQIDISYLKSVLRRRKGTIIWVFIVAMISCIMLAVLLPPVYRSQVGIMIDEQQIPENFVQSSFTSFVEERIQTITKQVMSRSRLLEIIKKYDLYSELSDTHSEDELIRKLRNNISLETMTANVGRLDSVTIGFTLSYSGRTPNKLQAVANELAYLYIEEEHKAKEKIASVTTDFLQQESNNFKEHIAELESKIGDFKKIHVGELPENYSGNIQALERLERQLNDIEREIRVVEERKLYLKAQISNIEPMTPVMVDGNNVMMNPAERLKRLRLELISKRTNYSDKHPDIIKLQKEIKELEGQVGDQDDSSLKIKMLSDMQGNLATLRGRLGEKHPDVIKLKKEYEALSKEIDHMMAVQVATDTRGVARPDNPVYINLMTQIVTIDSQIEGYREEQEQVKKEIASYRKRIENGPVVETEYYNLTRDLDTTKGKYNDLMGKLMQARVQQGMESSQRGERFKISEPANMPDKPYKPNRLLIVVLGFLAAIGVSSGLAALLEAVDVSIKSVKDISNQTGLPVFSVFPMIQTSEEKRKIRKKRLIYALSFGVLFLLFVIVVDQVVMPLDVMWAKTRNRLVEIGVPIGVESKFQK